MSSQPIHFDVDAAIERIDGRPVVLSVSGGKDSTATGLLLIEAGIPFRSVHCDTGWEHQDTERYIRDVLPGILGPIEIIQGKHGGMESLCCHKGMLPSRTKRFCTLELKVRPFLEWVSAYEEATDEEVVNAVGIRNSESAARANLGEWGQNGEVMMWRPVISCSTEDVIGIHRRHGIVPSPLYLRGATRVGCYPCIFARKKEIRMIADKDPARIDRLEDLERGIGDAAQERDPENARPTWFQNPTMRTNKAKGISAGPGWPIRKVVEWSRTARGGKQFDMFPDYGTDGCMRWGMCETS